MEFLLIFDHFLPLGILFLELLSLLKHLVDLILGEASRRLDSHSVVLSSGLVLGVDVYYTVGVDIEGDLDLGDLWEQEGFQKYRISPKVCYLQSFLSRPRTL